MGIDHLPNKLVCTFVLMMGVTKWVLVISSQDPLWKSHFHQIPLVIELNTNLNKLVVAGEELKRLGVTAAWTLLDVTAVD